MKFRKYWSLIISLTVSMLPAISNGQAISQNQVTGSVTGYDPIVETLDSLVIINNVIRYNTVNGQAQGETSKFDLNEYSDEIYAQRISRIYSPIPLVYNDEVKKYIDLYAYRKRALTSRVLGLSNLYFPLYEQILDQEGLPLEFKYLSVVESALNPVAVSRVGATGLWQFMFNTGKLYDLKINSYYDERRDPEKATRAACRYFKDMYAIYGDWLLVIAAYNCGAGNVNKAIRRAGGKTDFWEISRYLPAETRGYVPAFFAVTYVMNYANEHRIFPVQPAFNYFEVDTVAVDGGISLNKIAGAVGLPPDVLAFLNPVYKRGVIPNTEYPNVLRLPASVIPAYLAAEPELFAPATPQLAEINTTPQENVTASGINQPVNDGAAFRLESRKIRKLYTVKSGETLSAISGKLDCSVTELKKWNKLNSNVILKGQRLSYYATIQIKVPVAQEPAVAKNSQDSSQMTAGKGVADSSSSGKSETVAESGLNGSTARQGFIYHKVEKGDTLWNIARRYEGVTVEQIKELNKITDGNSLIPGTRIKVKVNG